MNRQWTGILALAVCASSAAATVFAQEQATDAERSWRDLRTSRDTRTKLLAERWYGVVRLQEWTNDTGEFTTTAKYVGHDPDLGWVKLRIIAGTGRERLVKDVTIPLSKLSKTCQSRVRQINTLAPKIAEAKVEELKRQAEDKEGAPAVVEEAAREGEVLPDEMRGGEIAPDGARPGRGPRDLAGDDRGMNPEDSFVPNGAGIGLGRERATPAATAPAPVMFVDAAKSPPLPAMLPSLPSGQLPPAPASTETLSIDASRR